MIITKNNFLYKYIEYTDYIALLECDEFKQIDESLKSLTTKATSVRSHLTKRGVYVKQHERDQHVSDKVDTKDIENSSKIKEIDDSEIQEFSFLDDGESGVSKGTMYFKDDAGIGHYQKPVKGETFTVPSGKFLRDTIRLNKRDTGEPLTDPDAYKIVLKNAPELQKGTMADREVATSILADLMGMDHVTSTAKRTQMGLLSTISQSVHDKYKDTHDNIMLHDDFVKHKKLEHGNKVSLDRESLLDRVSKEDPNRGIKAIFDFIIGNTDRHIGNMAIGKNKESGNYEMLAFDHGLTFPNNNDKYMNGNDYITQHGFNSKMTKGALLSESDAKKLQDFAASEKYKQYKQFVADSIGINEANAFNERYRAVMKSISPQLKRMLKAGKIK